MIPEIIYKVGEVEYQDLMDALEHAREIAHVTKRNVYLHKYTIDGKPLGGYFCNEEFYENKIKQMKP